MTSSKLAIADKQEILRLYCETDLSTAKLSKQFGISSSSTLRLLQEMMSPEEYKEAVQKKQAKPKKVQKIVKPEIDQLGLELLDSDLAFENFDRNSEDPEVQEDFINAPEITQEIINQAELSTSTISLELDRDFDLAIDHDFEPFSETPQSVVEDLASELAGSDILDIDDDEFDEDEDLEPEDEELEDEESHPNILPIVDIGLKIAPNILVILPLEQAELSNICYIVVDKASEIVTRPMRDFKDLGKVPSEEINLLALPVFDNHRAARRFSAHNQKVIKFPSVLIHATKSHLSKKGITRLLYGGQIFALV